MKKLLLTALSACAMLTAAAGISGTYVVKSYKVTYVGTDYTFANGEEYVGETAEDGWNVTITEENGVVKFTNLLAWEDPDDLENYPADEISGTYADGVITITGSTIVNEDYGLVGGLGKSTLTAQAIMDACDQYNSYVPDWAKHDITFTVEGNTITCATPILVYAIGDYSGYIGYAYELFSELVLEKDAEVAGEVTLSLESAVVVDADDEWLLTDESTVTEEDGWNITLTPGFAASMTITNLLSWEETLNASFDAETEIITIPADQVAAIYVDEDTNEETTYKVCGGLKNYEEAEALITFINTYGGYVAAYKTLDIKIKVEEGKISLLTPILIYAADDSYEGYMGYAYEVVKSMVFTGEFTEAPAIEIENAEAPVEYYNIQGMRIANPTQGQIVIMRQGKKVQKLIVR